MTVTLPPMTPLLRCSPKWATRRRPERKSFGSDLAKIAVALGQPFMPWQHDAAMVGCEIDPATGLPAYREVIITVSRQQGKTTLYLSWQISRCVSPRWAQPQRSAFTAQSGKDARDKWLDELFPLIRRSRKLKPLVRRIYEGMGNEYIAFHNGSLIRLLSTSTSSGHSKTLNQAVLDEIWHDADGRREQGLRPAMITIPDAQLLVCSTAGTDASVVLNRKVGVGRAAAEADSGHGVAYVEYSAPDGWDPLDEDSYFGFMPALCPSPPCRCGDGRWRHTITMDAIRSERASMEASEFARAYGNVPSRSSKSWAVIAEQDWGDRMDTDAPRPASPSFAIDTTPDRSFTSIGLAGSRPDGRAGIEVAEHRPGTSWVVARAAEIDRRWGPNCTWVVDVAGSAGSLVADLEDAGLSIIKPTARDVAHACGQFYDAVRDDKLAHTADADLRSALAGATWRDLGAARAFDRRSITVVLSPLMAVTLAHWGHLRYGGAYDASSSVHLDAAEIARLYGLGAYGPHDIARLWQAGILDAAGLTLLAARGIPVPAGLT